MGMWSKQTQKKPNGRQTKTYHCVLEVLLHTQNETDSEKTYKQRM